MMLKFLEIMIDNPSCAPLEKEESRRIPAVGRAAENHPRVLLRHPK